MIIFEAWEDENGITFTTRENFFDFKDKNLISSDARFLHQIEASTYEEAMMQHHIKMKWEPYSPLDKIDT
jgi:hypothetical protein